MSEWARRNAAKSAAAIINGKLGVIEGCRRLADVAHSLVPDWVADEDFVVFGAIASETDALPTGTARQYWSSEALAREDREIARYESIVRERVFAACRNILARFKDERGASV